jgi:hypothetical protein
VFSQPAPGIGNAVEDARFKRWPVDVDEEIRN